MKRPCFFNHNIGHNQNGDPAEVLPLPKGVDYTVVIDELRQFGTGVDIPDKFCPLVFPKEGQAISVSREKPLINMKTLEHR